VKIFRIDNGELTNIPRGPLAPSRPVAPVLPDGPESPRGPLGPEGPEGPPEPQNLKQSRLLHNLTRRKCPFKV
jgi:hypothetical protein